MGYLINQLHIYLSVTARIRESDVVQCKKVQKNDQRDHIIQQCFDLWKSISKVSPVHLTIADFGSVNMSECIRLTNDLKPSNEYVVFELPERTQDALELIDQLKNNPHLIENEHQSLVFWWGKVTQ